MFFLGSEAVQFIVTAIALLDRHHVVTDIFGKFKHEGRFHKNLLFKQTMKGLLILCFMTYLLTANVLTPSGSSTLHIFYTQKIHRTTK